MRWLAVFLALAFLFPAVAAGGPPGTWTKVTGTVQPNLNIDGLSAARTPDGRLHFLSVRRSGLGGAVQHGALSADAKTLSPVSDVFAYPGGVNEDPFLLAVSGGLRAFFAGLWNGPHPLQSGLATATSSDGAAWAVKPTLASSANPPAPVYAASGIGAALLGNGTPLTAWGSPGGAAHLGIDPFAPDIVYESDCCGQSVYEPGIGVDAATGQAVVAWKFISNTGAAGTAARALLPAGPRVQPPGGAAADSLIQTGITGRLGGKDGVYLAYEQGTNQFLARPAVWRFGGAKATTLSSQTGARSIGITPAPEGRLWVYWHRQGKITARRSNKAATAWGAPQTVAPATGTQTIYRVTGEGSAGPLDAFGLFDRGGNDRGYWQTRILPVLTLTATKGKTTTKKVGKKIVKKVKVTFAVRDVGDPVPGATVSVGGGAKTTGGDGKVTFTLAPGKHSAQAKKSGYVPGKTTVKT